MLQKLKIMSNGRAKCRPFNNKLLQKKSVTAFERKPKEVMPKALAPTFLKLITEIGTIDLCKRTYICMQNCSWNENHMLIKK
jgi:hypothetical protein